MSKDKSTRPVTAGSATLPSDVSAIRLLSLYHHTYNKKPAQPQEVYRHSIESKPMKPGAVVKWNHASHPGISSWTVLKTLPKRGELVLDVLDDLDQVVSWDSMFDVRLVTNPRKTIVWDSRSFPVLVEALDYVQYLDGQLRASVNLKERRSDLEVNFGRLATALMRLVDEVKYRVDHEQEVVLYHPTGLSVKVLSCETAMDVARRNPK